MLLRREKERRKIRAGDLGRESADVRGAVSVTEEVVSQDSGGLVPLWRENVRNESSA